MYLPRLFRETNHEALVALIRQRSFGTLIAVGDDGAPEIAHLPFVYDATAGPYGTLLGHLAKPNPMAQLATSDRALVAVFNGPHGYVSASFYGEPTEQVPTWNYAVAHVHGRGRALERHELRDFLERLSEQHDDVWRIEAMNPVLLEELLSAIVGFAIPIERIEGKYKLSQNRSPNDHARVVAALRARGTEDDLAMAELMDRSVIAARST